MTQQSHTSPSHSRSNDRSRPSGTRLTSEQKQLIVRLIEAGATDYAAAESAGISSRTFRELRQRAEGRHPTRRSTPDLKTFFTEVDEAIARARIKREIEVAETDPKHWLKYRARSKPGFEGWTEPVPAEPEPNETVPILSPDQLQEIVATLVASRAVVLPRCGDPVCVCTYHRAGATTGEGDPDA